MKQKGAKEAKRWETANYANYANGVGKRGSQISTAMPMEAMTRQTMKAKSVPRSATLPVRCYHCGRDTMGGFAASAWQATLSWANTVVLSNECSQLDQGCKLLLGQLNLAAKPT